MLRSQNSSCPARIECLYGNFLSRLGVVLATDAGSCLAEMEARSYEEVIEFTLQAGS